MKPPSDYPPISAQALNARAYKAHDQIVFNTGEYSPTTLSGKRFLAHELTHVVQQQHLPGACSTQPPYSQSDHPAEQKADRIAATITSNQAVSVSEKDSTPTPPLVDLPRLMYMAVD